MARWLRSDEVLDEFTVRQMKWQRVKDRTPAGDQRGEAQGRELAYKEAIRFIKHMTDRSNLTGSGVSGGGDVVAVEMSRLDAEAAQQALATYAAEHPTPLVGPAIVALMRAFTTDPNDDCSERLGRSVEPAKERSDKAVSPSNKKLIERLGAEAKLASGPHPLMPTETGDLLHLAASALEEREGLEAALRTIAAERFFYCNKCGHMGKDGPGHIGCSYLAAESESSRVAQAALSPPPIEKAGGK